MVSLEKMITTQEISRTRKDEGALLDYANRKRQEDRFNDVKIKVENETFPANRMVLSCYSDYFDRMFQTNMMERYQDEVVMNEITKTSMKLIIEFIYTGNIKINKGNVRDLLSAADMLCINDVKIFCVEFLEMSITMDTCFTILSLADLYRSEKLQTRVKSFLEENINDVVLSQDFMSLDLNKMKSVFTDNQVPELTLYKAYLEWTKHDVENRRCHFSDLFAKVYLPAISTEYLENEMSNESLVSDDFGCLRKHHHEILRRSRLAKQGGSSRVLSIGGRNTMQNVFEVVNVSGSPTRNYPDLPQKKHAPCCTVLHGNVVYAIGGATEVKDDSITSQVCRLDMKMDNLEWEVVASMKVRRRVMGAAVFNETIFVVGGLNENGDQLSSGEYYTSTFNRWADISPMKQPRSGNAAVSCRGYIYSLGGYGSNKYLSSVERFHPGNDVWDDVPSMKVPRNWLAAVALNDTHIYAIGGLAGEEDATLQKSVERYDVTTNKWSDVGEMNVERSSHAACVLQGKIYVVGGVDKNKYAVKSIECYDPTTNKWTIVGETYERLLFHALVAI
ncbi:kelch-like protein 25 [Clavelina lepadiformis]|uniref:kelch-like protein 25 n=1 Tax=Clavelina lepadiformis TaxID=159417 RepID=UPI004042453F